MRAEEPISPYARAYPDFAPDVRIGKGDRQTVGREEGGGERRGEGAKLSAERKGDLKLLLGGDDSSSPRVARRTRILLANDSLAVS